MALVKPKSPFGYIYLIGSRTFQWYKIGKARRAHLRLSTIGILLPFKIELFAMWEAWSADAEQRMQRKYAASRIHGEWFRFKAKELFALIEEPQENMLLLRNEGRIKFTNLESDSPEGTKLKVKIKIRPIKIFDPYDIVQRILAKKIRSVAKQF